MCKILLILDYNHFSLLFLGYSHFSLKRGVPQTPTLRIPLKLQSKPRVLGFFDIGLTTKLVKCKHKSYRESSLLYETFCGY